MKYVGIDLHKKTIVVCVVSQDRKVLERKKFLCLDVKSIAAWFGKGKDLGITKKGSRLLRWAMVESAWAVVANSARWSGVYEALKKRRQSKRAIVAVARRLLAVLVSMLKSGTKYRSSLAELKDREAKAEKRLKRRRAAKALKEAVAA